MHFLKIKIQLSNKQWSTLISCGIIVLSLSIFQLFQFHQSLQIKVLDIGQGDSILIQTPEYKNILIDTGYDIKVIDQLGKELNLFNAQIDLLIITHAHRDHYGGIFEILDKYQVKQVMVNGTTTKDYLYHEMVSELKKRKIPILIPNHKTDLQIGSNLYLDFLYPLAGKNLIGFNTKNKNNDSIVFRLIRKHQNTIEPLALFTGDAEVELEHLLLLSGQNVTAPVLKVGHHGSRTASTSEFIEAVQPERAIISAGKGNIYKHPHPETIDIFHKHHIEAEVTKDDGTVIVDF